MIWVALAFVGVPLWLIAAGIVVVVSRSRQLRHRPGNVPVRVHEAGKGPAKGWRRGNAVWVRDVFAFRGWPAAWSEVLAGVSSASTRAPTEAEEHALRRIDAPWWRSWSSTTAGSSMWRRTAGASRSSWGRTPAS